MSDYPEHDKMQTIAEHSQKIGEFLDWLRHEKHVQMLTTSVFTERCPVASCDPRDEGQYCPRCDNTGVIQIKADTPFWPNPVSLLAEYFEIDLDKIEDEKRAMLEKLRNAS
jgi:hypothetical protein